MVPVALPGSLKKEYSVSHFIYFYNTKHNKPEPNERTLKPLLLSFKKIKKFKVKTSIRNKMHDSLPEKSVRLHRAILITGAYNGNLQMIAHCRG